MQRIDHGVSGYVDRRRVDVFASKRFGRGIGWGEVERGEAADDLAVDLFGPRMVDVAAPEARLDVGDRNLAVVGGERPGHRGGSVALDHHPIGPFFIEYFADAGEQRGGERSEERRVGKECSTWVWA